MQQVAPNVRELFFAALELESSEARSAFLDQHCSDPKLRRQVEELLAVDAQGSDFLETPASMPTVADHGSHLAVEEPGMAIGPYKLLEAIGEGGMGTVYMAEQTEPVRRRVALKVIKPGMDSKQVVARFEAERQALAMMDHPNIAKVHDGGMTSSGRPYFVMELVRGRPITEYCDREQLSIRERLELFVLVCRAVQHAHQKGVIHRDLKPSNVLVTVIDGAGVPKVIDFGVAKATGQALADRTLFTSFHQFVGTPLYVSPEQAELSGVDIDTRSDIYSLGVILYEIVTGTTPFDAEMLKRAAFDEMRRIIREEKPPKPSTRLSTLGARLSTVSAWRKAAPRRLGAPVKGEIDWVVMKALEKDRRRRYETANDFAADVINDLADRPVEACPPSAWYRAAKFARRNRAALMTSALLALALATGTAVSVWQAVRATRAGALAAQREGEARDAAAESKAVLGFLVKDLLAAAEPEEALGRDVKVLEVLVNAEKKVEAAFHGRPLVEAGVRHALAHAYHGIGRYSDARRHVSRAAELRRSHLGAEHPEALGSIALLTDLLVHLEELKEASELGERTLEARRRILGPEHPGTLTAMNHLANDLLSLERWAEGRQLEEELLEVSLRVLGPEHPQTFYPMHEVMRLMTRPKGISEADRTRAVSLGRQLTRHHAKNALSWKELGLAEYRAGHWDAAIQAEEKAVELSGGKGWAFHYLVLEMSYARKGETDRAREWYAKARPAVDARKGLGDTPRWLVDDATAVLGETTPVKDVPRERDRQPRTRQAIESQPVNVLSRSGGLGWSKNDRILSGSPRASPSSRTSQPWSSSKSFGK